MVRVWQIGATVLHKAAGGGSVAALDLIWVAYDMPPLEAADQVSNGALCVRGRVGAMF